MKYLKRINESKTDYDFIYDCFAELIDNGVSYPEYKVSTEIFVSSINIQIFATEEEKEQYPF